MLCSLLENVFALDKIKALNKSATVIRWTEVAMENTQVICSCLNTHQKSHTFEYSNININSKKSKAKQQ